MAYRHRSHCNGIYSILLAGVMAAFMAVTVPPEVPAASADERPVRLKRHVIIGIDISTSMRRMLKNRRNAREMETLVNEILYQRIPTSVNRSHTLDETILDRSALDYGSALYRPGDTLTVFEFGEDVDYIRQRKKGFLDSAGLDKAMPDYPRGYKADYTFTAAAEVAAYESFNPDADGEAFFMLISDKGKDPPPGSRPEYVNYVNSRLNGYRRQFHMLPCYSLRLHDRVWIEIYKLRRLQGGGTEPPPGDPFWIVSDTNPERRLSELTFKTDPQSETARLADPSVLIPNPELKQRVNIEELPGFATCFGCGS